ncbi:MAG TPA: helix-turn-helix transcriptional regulator, partial [Gemmatimonadaceae bacterium]|nr:helix-turn-helix transcriptional regulator [Gemmatimonadaceae bacterium]
MAKRPVFFPDLGDYFRALRLAKGLGFNQAVEHAHQRGMAGLTKQVLFGLEHGQTKDPEPDALRAVADLYGVPYRDVVARVSGAKYRCDLIGHAGEGTSNLTKGGADVPASDQAHIRGLEAELRDRDRRHTAAIRAMRDVTRRLANALAR